ncbi:MAG TPA: hypothetical protein VGM75_27920 [Pseudonocardiaceae bacterium]|jgi:hypothetical protein
MTVSAGQRADSVGDIERVILSFLETRTGVSWEPDRELVGGLRATTGDHDG